VDVDLLVDDFLEFSLVERTRSYSFKLFRKRSNTGWPCPYCFYHFLHVNVMFQQVNFDLIFEPKCMCFHIAENGACDANPDEYELTVSNRR